MTSGCVWHAGAAEVRTYMSVSAVISQAVSIRTLHQTHALVVTAHDVERGYVTVPGASRFEIAHRGSCLLEFQAAASVFTSVKVSARGGAVEFGREGGSLLHRSSGAGSTNVAVDYRFVLAPHVLPGTYPWPLTLTVLPM